MSAPLRSEIDYSKTGIIRCPETDRSQIEHHIGKEGGVVASADGSAILVSNDYPAFEGAIANGPFLRLALANRTSGRLVQHLDGATLEGVWRAGSLTISPPRAQGFARSSSMSVIGLALLPPDMPPQSGNHGFDLDHVNKLAGHFHNDAILASIITAMHYGAHVHGESTAFFDHGKDLVLRRLSELGGFKVRIPKAYPLSDSRYGRVLDYVEDRLSCNITVSEMAEIAGLDSSGFTRALQARTGMAPYAWLTHCRMQRALTLLRGGTPVTKTAAMLSYENPSKFSAAFRRVIGMSPSRWSRAARS